ncbi:MAG: RES family NAD+ phosphorylase [Propionibacteriaceae bacterium]|nr:RES family NAD+ phosphorylase [Propionibacteriaceae bacterium]
MLRITPAALWRVHRTLGARVSPWNALRTWGPLPTMRFDPHPAPVGDHPGHGVIYTATDLPTALAETYQGTRLIDTVSFAPQATAWRPVRALRLLDLDGGWALRNGAAHVLPGAPTVICRAWARAIHTTWPDLDGLWAPSTMTGRPNVILWSPAADSFPAAPAFSRPLAHPMVTAVIRQIAPTLGYGVL